MFIDLSSNRFWLRLIERADQEFIFEGLSHPLVIPFYGVSYSSFEETEEQMNWYERIREEESGCWWKIIDKETGVAVGAVGFNNFKKEHRKAEIGYWLLPPFWQKGIIAEVLPVLISYLQKEVKVHRIEALVEKENEASIKVLERANFSFEGIMHDCEIKNGRFISLSIYSLLSEKK